MAFEAYFKAEKDVILPAVLGLAVVAVTVIVLIYLRRRKFGAAGARGTEYVTNLDGSTVRRSTRLVNIQTRISSAGAPT